MPKVASSDPELCSVMYGPDRIDFSIKFQENKRFIIDVHPDQTVSVKVPLGKTIEEIKQKVLNRASWIVNQQRYFEQFQPLQPPKRFISGETHLYLGRQYRLKVIASEQKSVKLIGRYLMVETSNKEDHETIKRQVEQWYKDHAKPLLMRYVDQCYKKVKRFGIQYPEIKIRLMKKRWGSFSTNGTISLNTELIKTPIYCIEYVIIHELCHLKVPNHSRNFFRLLGICLPDWEQRKKRLEKMAI